MEEHCHSHACFCFFGKALDWFKDRFYDREKRKYKHPWVMYVVTTIYLLHWLWHIAIGGAAISFIYNLFD